MAILLLLCLATSVSLFASTSEERIKKDKTVEITSIDASSGNLNTNDSSHNRNLMMQLSGIVAVVFIEVLLYAFTPSRVKNLLSRLPKPNLKKISYYFDPSEYRTPEEIEIMEYINGLVASERIAPSDNKFKNRLYIAITTNYQDPNFDLGALCREMGVSKTKCNSDCNLYYKMTPKEILNEYRLVQGLRLLQSSDFSVGTISDKIGFKTHSGFTKGFKRRFGYPPSQIIQLYQK